MTVESMKLINWKINLKNGQSLDLNVQDCDGFDQSIEKWVSSLDDRTPRIFECAFPTGRIWLSPSEFAMAVRSPYVQKEQAFEKVQEATVETIAVD